MTLNEALAGLNAQFRLEPFPPEEDGRTYYRFDEVTVGLAQAFQPGFLAARSWVGTVGCDDEAAVANLALANRRLPFAPDAVLGIDGEGEVFLDQRIGGDELTHDMLLNSLSRLVNEAQAWKQRLANGSPAAETKPDMGGLRA
ncbi:type III secretion system chaperone [Ramlibacter sp. AW1]|uniref:Type III secretion system chaperone n=1 Tax=Ramlibacter aurantiacus TaxID=2801330 RepID=A0A936ZKD5_9BURK|nr:type III secretion system chaperone [Ramlibacter aurantiacus]MBL0418810.1 type III secretion system chaperone [Ramlibacter aurantiacus]